ncbi:calcium-binding protein [Agrobacterium radiobacter]|uniref:calcium-binding protein n=1 Tax=Agrobacterium radiobacter TaxID=362 RepID=UPI003CF20436
MPTRSGTDSANTIDLRYETLTPSAGWPAYQAWWSVYAQGGNDTVYGSAYNDWIDGGSGNDTLRGYNGNDNLYGGAGTDYLYGGYGDDRLSGGADNDYLYGEAGEDWLDGGDGNDRLEGGANNDVLVGGAGTDVLLGGSGDDQIFGDAGADTMNGEAGDDRLWGNSGNDLYLFNGQGWDTINDGVTNGGTARTDTTFDTSDRLIVSYATSDVKFYTFTDNKNLLITSETDANDGMVDNAVIIENYFAGGHYVVEILQTSDGVHYLPDYFPLAA